MSVDTATLSTFASSYINIIINININISDFVHQPRVSADADHSFKFPAC